MIIAIAVPSFGSFFNATGALAPGFAFDGDGWRLTTCRASHAQPFLECVAFRLEASGKSLVYSADTGLNGDVKQLSTNAERCGAKRLMLSHFAHQWMIWPHIRRRVMR